MPQTIEYPRIAYKHGGPWECESGRYFVREVASAEEFEALSADGWRLDQYEAKAAAEQPAAPADDAPPTRAELEQKARELGIKFDGRTTDRRLSEQIAAKV